MVGLPKAGGTCPERGGGDVGERGEVGVGETLVGKFQEDVCEEEGDDIEEREVGK